MVDLAPCAAVLLMDLEMNVSSLNPAAEKLFGCKLSTGEGREFSFTLALQCGVEQGGEPKVVQPAASEVLRNLSILLLEDNLAKQQLAMALRMSP